MAPRNLANTIDLEKESAVITRGTKCQTRVVLEDSAISPLPDIFFVSPCKRHFEFDRRFV